MIAEQELPDLSHLPEVELEEWDAEGGGASEEAFGYGYWRRPDGWITTAQMNFSAIQAQERKGMESLPAYGKFVLNPPLRKNSQGVLIPQWIPRLRPYDRILELGGAHEFPVAQVLAHNWHRDCQVEVYDYRSDGTWRRSRRHIRFPQLAGIETSDWPCSTCGRMFNSAAEMKTHRSVAHPEEGTLEHLADMSKSLHDAIMSGQRDVTPEGALAAVLGQFAAALQQQNQVIEALLREREPTAGPTGRRQRNNPGPAPSGAPEVEPGEDSGTEE